MKKKTSKRGSKTEFTLTDVDSIRKFRNQALKKMVMEFAGIAEKEAVMKNISHLIWHGCLSPDEVISLMKKIKKTKGDGLKFLA